MTPREKVAKMRVRIHNYLPYLGTYVYTLKPQEREGLGTMAVDANANMYWDAKFVEEISVEQGAYVVAHETLHVVLRHHARSAAAYGTTPTKQQQFVMNVAADLVVEQALRSMAHLLPEGCIKLGCYCATLGMTLDFEPGLRMEEYYSLIMDRLKEQGGGGGGGDCDPDSRDKMVGGGSCADGVPRDYEEENDGSWERFGEQQAAESSKSAVERHEKSQPGSVPGCIKEAVNAVVGGVRDPWQQLRAAVASSVASPIGGRERTYQRISRKQSPAMRVILTGFRTTMPNAVVILDTSGSMFNAEDQAKALSCIAAGLSKLARFKVICGDTRITSRKDVSSIKQVRWHGGGGTDMAEIIEQVDRTDKPDSIVIVTDAETAWPSHATKARLIVASTSSSDYWVSRIPSWARTVVLAD